jgi:NTP pyrophosphatase (non-canonical NTP hydrolase)
MTLSFDALTEANRARVERWHPGFPFQSDWIGVDWSNAMCGEAGEAANIVKKIRRYDAGLRAVGDPAKAVLVEALAEELADVICYLDLLAQYYEIDLPLAVVDKFNRVSEKQGFPERLGLACIRD